MRYDIVVAVIAGVVYVSLSKCEAIKCYMCNNKDSENCKTGECNTAGSCHTTYSLGKIVQKSCGNGEEANDTCQWYGEDAYSCTCKGKDFCNDFIAGQAPPTDPPSPKKGIKCYECKTKDGKNCNTGECTTTGSCRTSINLGIFISKDCGGGEIVNDPTCESIVDVSMCMCRNKDFCNDFVADRRQPTAGTPEPSQPPPPASTEESAYVVAHLCNDLDENGKQKASHQAIQDSGTRNRNNQPQSYVANMVSIVVCAIAIGLVM